MPDIDIQVPAGSWKPRRHQRPLWRYLQDGGKRAVAAWARHSGKDEMALHWTAVAAVERRGNYWHCLPQASQARKAIWEAVNPHTGRRRIDEAFPKEMREVTRENEMMIRFINGSTWQVVGSDNYDSLVGAPPAGLVFSEYALSDPQAWAILRPILAENDGWVLFISTPRGRNHFATLFEAARDDPSWFAQKLTAWDTGILSPERLEQERREYERELGEEIGEAMFRQEYACDFSAPVLGAYYARELAEAEDAKPSPRIGKVPVDPALPCVTAWDLGIGDSTAIWIAQCLGHEVRLVDYIESAGVGLDWYAKELDRRGYRYREHLVPHDAEARELGTGRTRIETMRQLGLGSVRVVTKHAVFDGINAARRILPRCWFDAERCARGLEALRNYRAVWDDKARTFRAMPLHSWASHGADAFRYLAMGLEEPYDESRRRPPVRTARQLAWVG